MIIFNKVIKIYIFDDIFINFVIIYNNLLLILFMLKNIFKNSWKIFKNYKIYKKN